MIPKGYTDREARAAFDRIRDELAHAAANGVSEYLNSIRGAALFGSNLTVVESGSTVSVQTKDGTLFYHFTVIRNPL